MTSGDLIPIMAILSGTLMVVLVVALALLSRAIGRRGASRRELQELRQDISHIKNQIDDIREQLADIIIRLS